MTRACCCAACAFFRPWMPGDEWAPGGSDGVCSAMPHAIMVTRDSGSDCDVFRAARAEDHARLSRRAARAGFELPGADK